MEAMSTIEAQRESYLVGPCLGEGGFGTVYRAQLRDGQGFAKDIALKIFHADLMGRKGLIKRFRDEARMLGLLRHPHIVGVHGMTRFEGTWAVCMEYIHGANLESILDHDGPLPPSIALQLAEAASSALMYAWNFTPAGETEPLHLTHRDVKPSNLMIDEHGSIKLLDFGAASADFSSREAKTRIGGPTGTLAYMAPERWLGRKVPSTDLYALATTLLQALTGSAPPQADTFDVFDAWRTQMLRTVEALGLSDVHALCARAVADADAKRPTREAFHAELRRIRRNMASTTSMAEWAEQVVHPILRTHDALPREGLFSGRTITSASDTLPHGDTQDHTSIDTLNLPSPELSLVDPSATLDGEFHDDEFRSYRPQAPVFAFMALLVTISTGLYVLGSSRIETTAAEQGPVAEATSEQSLLTVSGKAKHYKITDVAVGRMHTLKRGQPIALEPGTYALTALFDEGGQTHQLLDLSAGTDIDLHCEQPGVPCKVDDPRD